jgi:hypothetical protein
LNGEAESVPELINGIKDRLVAARPEYPRNLKKMPIKTTYGFMASVR